MTGITTGGAQISADAKPFYKVLYVQVLFALVLGALIGWMYPGFATSDWIKALGDGFVKLIKMMIALIIFCTVVSGISGVGDAKKVVSWWEGELDRDKLALGLSRNVDTTNVAEAATL